MYYDLIYNLYGEYHGLLLDKFHIRYPHQLRNLDFHDLRFPCSGNGGIPPVFRHCTTAHADGKTNHHAYGLYDSVCDSAQQYEYAVHDDVYGEHCLFFAKRLGTLQIS